MFTAIKLTVDFRDGRFVMTYGHSDVTTTCATAGGLARAFEREVVKCFGDPNKPAVVDPESDKTFPAE